MLFQHSMSISQKLMSIYANTVHEKMRNIANCVSSFLETKFNVVNLSIWLYSKAIGNL